jgi:hypothetical protein
MTETYPEARRHRLANRPNEKTLLQRIARYTLAGLGACALMVTTADATGLVNGGKIEPRTSAEDQSKPGSLTAQSSKNGATRKNGRGSGQSPKRRISRTGRADSARWRTGRRRACGRRCR